jgi:protocatechuate 3,4-dioxygenase, beta subunit
MANSLLARRKALYAPLVYAAAWYLLGNDSFASPLLPTAAQTAGPFYPLTFPTDSDNDLLHVAGHSGVAHGIPTKISGRVLDLSGRPITGARIEIWQCDANGRYHYVRDDRTDQSRDDDFQGYGTTTTNETGGYEFLTIKPVPYPGRTPHIHFAVSGRGFERFVTQMYVAGEPRNEADPLFLGVRDPAARARLLVGLQSSPEIGPTGLTGTFDIVLAGSG